MNRREAPGAGHGTSAQEPARSQATSKDAGTRRARLGGRRPSGESLLGVATARMRRGVAVGVLAALAGLLGAAGAGPAASAASSARTGPVSALVDACGAGSYQMEPTSVVLACADAGIIATKLVWTSWTRTRAVATGDATVNDCTPACVEGRVYAYPAALTLSEARLHDGRLLFTVATLRFTERLPVDWHGGRVLTYPIPIAPRTTDAEMLVTETWTTFFSGASSVAGKAALLEHGTVRTSQIRRLFSRLPKDLTTKVDAVVVEGRTARVSFRFFAGPDRYSHAQTGVSVEVDGQWLVSAATFSELLTTSGTRGG